MVQSVLRSGIGKRLLDRVTGADDVCFLYPDGFERRLLERLGNHLKRMERLFTENDSSIIDRIVGADRLLIPT